MRVTEAWTVTKKKTKKKKPQKTKNLDFISEHRNLQITKLFCPSVLDCALKTPKQSIYFAARKQNRDAQGKAENLSSAGSNRPR